MHLISRLFSHVIDYSVQSTTVCANFEHSFCFAHATEGAGNRDYAMGWTPPGSNLGRGKRLSLLQNAQTSCGAYLASHLMVTNVLPLV